jgi:tripartite-type tricarboxylate transporter receptor subunit TctC
MAKGSEDTMKITRLALLPMLGLGVLCPDASAETWPSKPIRAIVPLAAGSTTDIIPRIVFEELSRQLRQPIVVENQPGAGATIGTAAVAKAEPDGYTILATGSGHTIAPALRPNLGYNPSRDFAAVIPLGISPNVLVVPAAKGWKTAGDLAAAAKKNPGALTFSSVGAGTVTHLSAERFRRSAGFEAVHVPFKGGGEAITEVIAGRVDFFFGPVGLALPHIKGGKLLALAVNGTQRSAALPNVPTTSEAGYANAELPIWFGLFVPAKTPREIVEKLHRETLQALRAPNVRAKLAGMGVDPMILTPREFDALVEKEIAVNAELVKSSGVKAH